MVAEPRDLRRLAHLAVGAGLTAVGDLTATGGDNWHDAGGWTLIGSAILGFPVATALMVRGAAGKAILPLMERGNEKSFKPGASITQPVEYEKGMPGLKQGQWPDLARARVRLVTARLCSGRAREMTRLRCRAPTDASPG